MIEIEKCENLNKQFSHNYFPFPDNSSKKLLHSLPTLIASNHPNHIFHTAVKLFFNNKAIFFFFFFFKKSANFDSSFINDIFFLSFCQLGQSNSLVTWGCFPNRSAGTTKLMHAWDLLLKYYEMKVCCKFSLLSFKFFSCLLPVNVM